MTCRVIGHDMSELEEIVKRHMVSWGYEVKHLPPGGSYPDFLAVRGLDAVFVEVKGANDRVDFDQGLRMTRLARAGHTVYVAKEEGNEIAYCKGALVIDTLDVSMGRELFRVRKDDPKAVKITAGHALDTEHYSRYWKDSP